MLIVSHRMGNLLRGSWHVVLDTLEQATALLVRKAIARPRWSPHASDTELAEVEGHCAEVLQAAVRRREAVFCLTPHCVGVTRRLLKRFPCDVWFFWKGCKFLAMFVLAPRHEGDKYICMYDVAFSPAVTYLAAGSVYCLYSE